MEDENNSQNRTSQGSETMSVEQKQSSISNSKNASTNTAYVESKSSEKISIVESDAAEGLTNAEFSKTLDMSSIKPAVYTTSDITQISDTNNGNESNPRYSDVDTRTTLKSLNSFDENRTLEEVRQQSNDLPFNIETKSQLLLSDVITSASRSRKSQTDLRAESLKTSRAPTGKNENIMSRSILSELKNSNTSSNNSTDRKISTNEQNSGLNTLYPGSVQDIEASAKTS